MEGPNPDNLKPIVEQAMPMLIDLLKDSSVVVRDTDAWTVGRVCELISEAVINDVYLDPLLRALVEGLNAEPRVAANVCWVGDREVLYLFRIIYGSKLIYIKLTVQLISNQIVQIKLLVLLICLEMIVHCILL